MSRTPTLPSAKKKRLDTKLESEGAEFLVLGNLLVEKVQTFKAYLNYPGYDLIATDPQSKTAARIQVKSRYQTDWDGFIIDSFECDFVVFVALNRGYARPRKNGDRGIREPEFFVLPIDWVKKAVDPANAWGKIPKTRLKGIESYKNCWNLVKEFLAPTGRKVT